MGKSRALLLFLSAVVVAMTSWAQIPNAGFESWTAAEPDNWATSNGAPLYTNVTKSSTAHTGSFAIRGDVVQAYSVNWAPTIQAGAGGHGFAYTQRPLSITGWYTFSSAGGDRFVVNVSLFKGGENGTPVAIAASADSTTRSTYTQFTVPFTYLSADVPDLCIAQFLASVPLGGSTVHVGTYFLLDDLALFGSTDVRASTETPLSFMLAQNYPNPFNPRTTIQFTIANRELTIVKVYDLLGREVTTLVNEVKSPGTYTVEFDGSNLASGVYFYTIRAGEFVQTRRLLLLR